MTPIRVRGKRGQKARIRALHEERARRAADEEVVTDSSTFATPSTSPLSKLECLPTELLESIFLYSQEVNLPRASLALGRALSSAHVKHKLLRSLLTDSYPLPHDGSEEELRVGKLQSRLLTCRWLDLASYRRAFAATLASVLEDVLEKPCGGFTKLNYTNRGCFSRVADVGLFIPSISQFVDYYLSQPVTAVPVQWSIDTTDQWGISLDCNRLRVRQPELSIDFHVREGCTMPTRLLRGPWTEEKRQFLHLMKCAGAALDLEGSNNWEVADQSLREAIIQGIGDVVLLLLRPWGSSTSSPSSKIPITVDHLRLAVFQGGCKSEIVKHLANYRDLNECFDWAQDDIMDWANEQKNRGDARGAWLLNKIDHLEKTKSL
ncbi:MAG: hypothetical protein Q9184_004926 [Pyrenodesmia sp. 2 TL-2023]